MPTEVNLPGAVISGSGEVAAKLGNAAEQAMKVIRTKEQLSDSAVDAHKFLSLSLLLSYLDGNPISLQNKEQFSINWSKDKFKELERKRALARFLGIPSGSTMGEVRFALDYATAAGATKLNTLLRSEDDESFRQTSSDLVRRLLEAQEIWKRNSKTHKIGASNFARRVEEKFGGGEVGLKESEQAVVVDNVEQSFNNMRVNSDLEEGLRACIDKSDNEVALVEQLCALLEDHVHTVYELYVWLQTASEFTGKLSDDQITIMNDLYLQKAARIIEPMKTTAEEHLAEHEQRTRK